MARKEKEVKGYKINYSKNTLTINYKFSKNAQERDSAEYELIKSIREDYPTIKIIIASGRNIKKSQLKKRVTYANMKQHIGAYANSTDLLNNFELAVELSKPLASPYKYVCDWFYTQFPEYKKSIPSIYNSKVGVKLVEMPDTGNYPLKEFPQA